MKFLPAFECFSFELKLLVSWIRLRSALCLVRRVASFVRFDLHLFCSGEGKHFNVIDFEEMGKVLCEVALEYREIQENARSVLFIASCP